MKSMRNSRPTVLRWTVRIAMASLALGMLTVPAATANAATARALATSQPNSSAPFAYMVNYNSNRCVEVPGYSTTAGLQLDQWSCVNQTNLLWRPYLNTSGQYVFWNENSRQCMNVRGYSTSNGAAIQQWPCQAATASANEVFYPYLFIGNINGRAWYEWAGRQSNKCLNIAGASQSNGGKLIQWDCIPTAKNEWFAMPYAS
jgi:Ricin-type beta-trefoil lectin domain-like